MQKPGHFIKDGFNKPIVESSVDIVPGDVVRLEVHVDSIYSMLTTTYGMVSNLITEYSKTILYRVVTPLGVYHVYGLRNGDVVSRVDRC